ncbi:phosphoribosylaminoimidazolesuccinocarboxamide synthase [Candidatus Kaiserbacteria bacterium RIFCSPLOWO2_01_FULL_54_13]|uniref:Phosphoribosylaminoimidazole-succinocarboxamide synthase n=1 Tax=Candidatus Kaiserbacteria bacterium RIFCSPLOWO2_01_FULL_54_13 TaxID=1798512 RepID=A0A1F6F209_9BACT|nr:MAG: phosphoribosylaminoimidazolesuccinocarboxamide synthase [Candidatus Kaiserbacteria bacterium RIFCSPLOWO2_01_FULL_54_13]
MTEVLKETNFVFLGKKRAGKVRDIYEPSTGSGRGSLILISTDRHSSFDRLIAHIPHKGQVLNQLSAFSFQKTEDIIPNHVIAVPDPNVTVAKKCNTVPVEAVVRGYLTGVTDTAIWTRYSKGEREFGGVVLPDGMTKNQKLPTPIFDPTTKEEMHDRALTPEKMISEGFITKELFEKIRDTAFALFARGQEIAAKRGLILVDTKYEFGLDTSTSLGAGGTLTLIDEIHTPDSSRYWQLGSYEERFARGEEPEYFDKEFLRLWFKEHCDPYKDKVLPPAPPELVEELSRRYIQMYEQITGEKFQPAEVPIIPRIERNLKQYAI